MLKWIDIPPVWLIAALVIAWWQAELFPAGLSFGGSWADVAGTGLVGLGILIALLALYEMRRFRTTPIPHMEAGHLVTTGIFARTRNPIYLGDALVLAGLILIWDAVLSLLLLPAFVWIIQHRFILAEERRLERKFQAGFARYREKTRRWM